MEIFDKVFNSNGGPGSFCDVESLEVTQGFMRTLYLMFPPLILVKYSDDEGNESVLEVGDKSNKHLSPPVHIYIQ